MTSLPFVHVLRRCGAVPLMAAAMALLTSTPATAGSFFLTADKVVPPGHAPSVQLEARSLRSVDVRVYRLENPRAYFDAQNDLHRPKVANSKPRKSVLGLLSLGAKIGVRDLHEQLRYDLKQDGRDLFAKTFRDENGIAESNPTSHSTKLVLPPLKDHPLVAAWQHRLPFKHGWQYDQLTLPVTDAGVYLVEVHAGSDVGHTVVVVSDVALVTKQSADELLVWAVHPLTGRPVANTKVDVLVRGKQSDNCTTDSDGLCRMRMSDTSSYVLYASHNKSFTLIDPRFYSANLPQPRVYVFTERPVYKPNQEVFFKGFARDVVKEAYTLPKGAGSVDVAVELQDPSGSVISETSVKMSTTGSFDGRFELGAEPKHGTWQIVVNVDEQKYAGAFKVMEYKKPEVKLTVRTDSSYARAGDLVEGDITGAYFFGAPYPGAEVKVTVTKTRFHVPWYVDADYSWYYSEAEYQNTKREVVEEMEGKLDDEGVMAFSFTPEAGTEDSTYVIEAVTKGPTGKTVVGRGKVTLTQGAFRLALDESTRIVEPGASHTLQVEAVDYDKNPVATDVEFRVKVTQKNGADVETVEFLTKKAKTDASGRANVTFTPSKGGYYEIEVHAKDDKGTKVSDSGFLFAAEEGQALPFAPSDVQIVLDKRSYFTGDTATVLVLTPSPDAQVLLTVEGGDLYRAEVKQAKNHAVLLTVDITQRQTPNFFVAATTLVGGQLFAKKRSVVVPPREQLLTVEVSGTPTKAKPGDTVEFKAIVTDHKGNPVEGVELAMGVVDEAIYAISPEIAVPMEGFFYSRKRNEVRTTDSLTFRFYGNARNMHQQTAHRFGRSPFGFGGSKPQLDDPRKVMKDTAAWFPSLMTDKKGEARVKVTLPDNLTSWRATARGMTQDARVGLGKGKVRASKDLMVRIAMPSRLVDGDEGKGALVVQNLSGKDQSVSTSLALTGDAQLSLATTAEGASATGADLKATLQVPNGQTLRVPFTYKTTGDGKLELLAKASGNGVNDALQVPLSVMPWATTKTVSAHGLGKAESDNAHVLDAGKELHKTTLTLTAMSSSKAAIQQTLPFLVQYPYGCVEQTMSRFLPALAAKDAVKQGALAEVGDVDDVVRAGVERLWQHQNRDGGWGWFGDMGSDVWMTAYVLEGLSRAKELGADVDDDRLKKAASRLERLLSRRSDPHVRAMAALALARVGKAPKAIMERLLQKAAGETLSTDTLSWLTLALVKSGDDEGAQEAAAHVLARVSTERPLHWEAKYKGVHAHKHPVEQTAVAMLALAAAKQGEEQRASASHYLLEQFRNGSFGSTRQTALAIRALQQNLSLYDKENAKLTLFVDDKEVGVSEEGKPLVVQLDNVKGKVNTRVVHGGGGVAHYALTLEGQERSKRMAASQEGALKLKRTIYKLNGSNGSWRKGSEAVTATGGDAVLVVLELKAQKALRHVMVEDLRPVGLVPILDDSRASVRGYRLRQRGVHREHRDDRSLFFVDKLKRGTTKFAYLARAGLAGSYRALPARAEAMYLTFEHDARSASTRFDVK